MGRVSSPRLVGAKVEKKRSFARIVEECRADVDRWIDSNALFCGETSSEARLGN